MMRFFFFVPISSMLLLGCFSNAILATKESLNGLLVFEDGGGGHANRPKIVISRVDGSRRRILREYGARPMWFPSGDRITLFIPDPLQYADGRANDNWYDGFYDYTGRLKHAGKTLIIDLEGHLIQEIPYRVTDISPDGTQFLVERIAEEGETFGGSRKGFDIYHYELDTEKLRKVIGLGDLPEAWQATSLVGGQWFPDGKSILFQVRRPNEYAEEFGGKFGFDVLSALAIVGINGENFRLITPLPEVKAPRYLSGPFEPDISPDGRDIVFIQYWEYPKGTVHERQNIQIYVMRADGSEIRQLTDDKDIKNTPIWSPDGKQILYSVNRSSEMHGEQAFRIIDAEGSRSRRLFPRTWRHFIKGLPFFPILLESDDHADWWAPSMGEKASNP